MNTPRSRSATASTAFARLDKDRDYRRRAAHSVEAAAGKSSWSRLLRHAGAKQTGSSSISSMAFDAAAQTEGGSAVVYMNGLALFIRSSMRLVSPAMNAPKEPRAFPSVPICI